MCSTRLFDTFNITGIDKNSKPFSSPFSKSKEETPIVTPTPTASPTPTIQPSEVSAQSAEQARRSRIQKLRSGLASTIKTGPQGLVDLNQQTNLKTKLGA